MRRLLDLLHVVALLALIALPLYLGLTIDRSLRRVTQALERTTVQVEQLRHEVLRQRERE